ncbi:Cytochrome P450 [Penicillium soppii]|uniref:Cytochrome P450 n=1 Tax=Penicillium soppii TaxID=69789 RepID=UPI0025493640|nr:Cytochrome P450 [Penicillium soppii]KAJ5856408.1 Cytochrome P450 [Penicillium soppii]
MDLLVPLVAGQLLRITHYTVGLGLVSIVLNVINQLVFYNKKEPPVVFHWVPFIGSTIAYGMDPYQFFFASRAKYGDIFTFILLGKKTTVYLGVEGNEFILNGKLKDVNAEEIYGKLTTPVFGSDVVYDCPNSKLMEQKKFIKHGLSTAALESYVPLIADETSAYIKTSPNFKGKSGTIDLTAAMAEITLFTAARTLQGDEVRSKLTSEFAELLHDLDLGFTPINFMLPWAPLPQNRKRDLAHAKMREIYLGIIQRRREGLSEVEGNGTNKQKDTEGTDMILNLMSSVYRDGTPVPDKEIAHMMITLLMAGQHSSSAISCWILLRLASQPEMTEKLYAEQVQNLGADLPPLQYKDMDKLPLHHNVIKETLRIHSSIHTLMRKVKNPLPVPGTDFVVPPSHTLLSSPGVTARDERYFRDPLRWDPHRWETRVEVEDDTDTVDYGYGAVSKGTRSPYLPFGAGRHRCIGEKFAYLNLGVIVATLVREFRFFNPEGREGVPETDYSSLFSRPIQPATVRWEVRP